MAGKKDHFDYYAVLQRNDFADLNIIVNVYDSTTEERIYNGSVKRVFLLNTDAGKPHPSLPLGMVYPAVLGEIVEAGALAGHKLWFMCVDAFKEIERPPAYLGRHGATVPPRGFVLKKGRESGLYLPDNALLPSTFSKLEPWYVEHPSVEHPAGLYLHWPITSSGPRTHFSTTPYLRTTLLDYQPVFHELRDEYLMQLNQIKDWQPNEGLAEFCKKKAALDAIARNMLAHFQTYQSYSVQDYIDDIHAGREPGHHAASDL